MCVCVGVLVGGWVDRGVVGVPCVACLRMVALGLLRPVWLFVREREGLETQRRWRREGCVKREGCASMRTHAHPNAHTLDRHAPHGTYKAHTAHTSVSRAVGGPERVLAHLQDVHLRACARASESE